MPSARGAHVELNQFLFGYEEGHRLLVGSEPLPESVIRILLPFSDLVPGLPTAKFRSYWTGFPVPQLRSYALMHTWPAPEMPRPGCVWTHLITIPFGELTGIDHLGSLRRLFRQPRGPSEFSTYKLPVFAYLEESNDLVDTGEELRVLRAVYSRDGTKVPSTDQDDIESAIFSVWSQQWPRLRRSFSFRTARTVSSFSTKERFDLELIADFRSASLHVDEGTSVASWERAALQDLAGGRSEFRRFLWRYGADQQRGTERFRFLAELFVSTRIPTIGHDELTTILAEIARTLPDLSDGRSLKEDLISAVPNGFMFFPPADAFALLQFFACGADKGALPLPRAGALEAIVRGLWNEHGHTIMGMADQAIAANATIADELLRCIGRVADADTFLVRSKDWMIARRRVIEINPTLLDGADALSLDSSELEHYLRGLSDLETADRLIGRFIPLDNASIAQLLTKQFPELVARRVRDALARFVGELGPAVSSSWLNAARALSPSVFSVLVAEAHTTSALSACAILLNWDLRQGLAVNPIVWGRAVSSAEDDISGDKRQRLLAYLLSLALAMPTAGCEPLFELSFQEVHEDIYWSRLPQDAFDILIGLLPNLFWWQQWDTCLRLRLATVRAYVESNLDPASFRRLASNEMLFRQLVKLGQESSQGRRFLAQIGY